LETFHCRREVEGALRLCQRGFSAAEIIQDRALLSSGTQHLTLTQLQQSIRLLGRHSSSAGNQKILDNPLLEREDGFHEESLGATPPVGSSADPSSATSTAAGFRGDSEPGSPMRALIPARRSLGESFSPVRRRARRQRRSRISAARSGNTNAARASDFAVIVVKAFEHDRSWSP
jgi:DNA-directed RNA polymerase specialized sigma54-like protein